MTQLENKEIKGITAKLIYTIIASTFIIVASGFTAFYGLKMEIVSVQNQNEIRRIELESLKTQVTANKLQIDALQKAFNESLSKH